MCNILSFWKNLYSLSLLILKRTKNALMFVWFLIFQHASTSFFPRGATNSEPNHIITGLVKKLLCLVSCVLARQLLVLQNNLFNLSQQYYCQTGQLSCWAHLNRNLKFPNSMVDVEGADNHPHSSVPPSPHPHDLLLAQHSSIHSAAFTRLCFLVMG